MDPNNSQDSQEQSKDLSTSQNQPHATRSIKYKLSRKYKAFADAYLLTLNASEAYRVVFKPKHPEYAYKRAYALLRDEGISRYVDEALASSCEANYRPEAIKEGIQTLAQTARRESDRLRAYELMSKISGLINDNQQAQVNFFDGDVMALARKRLSERKKDSQKEVVIDTESSQVLETKEDTESMSYNRGYGQTVSNDSVLSTNGNETDGQAEAQRDGDNGMVGDEGTPGEGRVETPTHGLK